MPVFNDEERAEVGTLYKQVGQEAAKERGLEIFSQKLPAFIAAFKKLPGPMTVFCWRGGMRSKTAATVLDLMGIHATRLYGGIRAYRHWVVEQLEKITFKPGLLVLNGYTGAGKTLLLERLAKAGYPVIDLEKMAGHRGSIFGQIGLEPSKQKKFESLLLEQLLIYQDAPFVFMEGESKRIGKVTMPDFLYNKKENGQQIFIDIPIGERIKNILDDYQPWDNPELFMEAFDRIKKRIHVPVAKQIEDDLINERYESATRLLLIYYYDPRYEYGMKQYNEKQKHVIHADNNEDAFQKLLAFVQELSPQLIEMTKQ
ncbi:tRNA 2-selenouridine(34) synthase MnmH [Virgibacillus sp. 179-BFC.A HS]|uniref:tRNA 2-selenouridine(34) synthase MnmH n=1 Tax=Tigheibacillus jepli TaxID=3035914 RepID=A0ABU5CKW3_9BACI|nr:tRNA 2-selenouridine(34) synthase MnmH [Virgibacillus sp. 179-BFC.A HS]MDY0407001.1 tRNA 2-selenouridine(34) synthase MnmH [Virgibacillus sp. 179-BFC.A HS]